MKAILTDTTKCIGCEKCVEACVKEFGLGPSPPFRWSSRDGLSANRLTSIIRLADDHYVRNQCRHCLSPACVSVCPVGALQKTPEGPVVYDETICIGCRYCMMACPYGIPKHGWGSYASYIHKCSMCYENRIKKGRVPACVEACPTQATIFGERKELIAEAERRLKAEPDKYVQRIYGRHEVGGSSVLYISDINLDFLGWKRQRGRTALPELTAPAMAAVPPAFLGMGALMYGVYRIIERRMENQKRPSESRKNRKGDNES